MVSRMSGSRPKDLQAAKIRTLGEALTVAGFVSLDERPINRAFFCSRSPNALNAENAEIPPAPDCRRGQGPWPKIALCFERVMKAAIPGR